MFRNPFRKRATSTEPPKPQPKAKAGRIICKIHFDDPQHDYVEIFTGYARTSKFCGSKLVLIYKAIEAFEEWQEQTHKRGFVNCLGSCRAIPVHRVQHIAIEYDPFYEVDVKSYD